MCLYARAQAPALFGSGRAPGLWICLLMACCAVSLTYAQVRPRGLDAYPEWQPQHTTVPAAADTTITTLQIGDTIPEALWHLPLQVINHPEGKETITLNDYRGKLIILDFWGPTCSYCISAFPKLDSLQSVFGEHLQIVLTTTRAREKIVEFHQRKPIPGQLFSVTGDSVLAKFFTHRSLPHYAWICPKGRFMATTNNSSVTPGNIRTVLNGATLRTVHKNDFALNRPFFLAEEATELPLHYSLFWRGQYPSVNSQLREHRQNNIVHGKSFANYTYRDLYYLIARPQFEAKGIRLTPNRWLLELSDTKSWLRTQDALKRSPDLLYTYELVVPPADAAQLDSLLLATLNAYTGHSASIRQVQVPCLVITAQERLAPSTPTSGKQTLASLIERWNLGRTPEGTPRLILLDESGYSSPIPKGVRARNMAELRTALAELGLVVIETVRNLDMLIITEN